MKIKKPIMYLIAIAIVGLLITSASSLPTKQASSQEDEINAEYLVAQSQPLLKTKNIDKSVKPLSFAGVPITDGDYDEYHPSVAGSPSGGFYALVEEYQTDTSAYEPTLYGSVDGIVWESIAYFLYDDAEYTDFDQNVYGTYGTFSAPPVESGKIVVFPGEDYTQGSEWDFGPDNINEFRYYRIACYTYEGPEGDPGNWNWGGLTFSGYNGYSGNNIVGCPFIAYPSSTTGLIISWLTGATSGCQHAGSAMDLAKNIMYSVWDRNTGTAWELLIRKDNFAQWVYNPTGGYWTHGNSMGTYHVTDTAANLTYPSAAAYDNHVIVTCMKDNDVVAYYSTNGFTTKTEVLIEEDAFYPEVVFAAEGKAILTYIKDNVLYNVTSDDGGATWSTAQVVSDNQVHLNDRAANLDEFQGGVYGVWEDTRGANIDAYFDIIYEFVNNPPNNPTIAGEKKIKKDVQFEYTFTSTDPEGQDVSYNIEWGDGSSTGWIGPYVSGTPATANHTWTTKDKFIIRCQAKDTYGAVSGWTEYSVSAPRARLIRLLDYFPNAFPLLRLIFGF